MLNNSPQPAQAPAPYASRAAESRGRLWPEPESATRTPFQRDRDRIIHCGAFRRLEYKTQVFVNHESGFFRTRLTHSLEVAQIARAVCRALGLDEDLGEALALAHDLGHPPFGHAGEDALKEAMAPFGGFDHNAQSLSVITQLERRYPKWDGLNLTWETLEGIVKHNGPLTGEIPRVIAEYTAGHDLEIDTFAGPEAQVAALADDIAYDNHDIEDGLRAELFTVADLADAPLAGPIFADARKRYPGLDESRLIHESVRGMIGAMVSDLTEETRRRLEQSGAQSAAAVRALGRPVAAFSEDMRAGERALKEFLFANMYRHYKLNRMTSKGRRVVRDLFGLLLHEPECLPTEWRARTDRPGTLQTAQIVADYIAGMTDRAALDEHRRLFDVQARTS
ncbi:MAG: deoxyguanosinetriphosphate triphosphohydrolase [Rhodospirillales bacterium]